MFKKLIKIGMFTILMLNVTTGSTHTMTSTVSTAARIAAINGAALFTGYKIQRILSEKTKDFGTKLARYGKTAEASAPALKFILGLVIPFVVNQICRHLPLPGAVNRFTTGPWRNAFSCIGAALATLYYEDREMQAFLITHAQ